MEVLLQNLQNIQANGVIMWAIGGVLIYLAIAKEMETTLLLPMGFGAILVIHSIGVIILAVKLLNKFTDGK